MSIRYVNCLCHERKQKSLMLGHPQDYLVPVRKDVMGYVIGTGGHRLEEIGLMTKTTITCKDKHSSEVVVTASDETSAFRAKLEIKRAISIAIRNGDVGSNFKEVKKTVEYPSALGSHLQAASLLTAASISDHQLEGLLQTATNTITEIYRSSSKNLPVADTWFHLGQIQSAIREDSMPRRRLREIAESGNSEMIHFESGVSKKTFDNIRTFLKKVDQSGPPVKFIQSYVRHDVEMYTPNDRDRRFRLFLPRKTPTKGEEINGCYTGCKKYVGSWLNKARDGFLYNVFPNWFRGDILHRDFEYDCRLIVRAGGVENVYGAVKKREETLRKKFEKGEYGMSYIKLPKLPENYCIHCRKRSVVYCYRLKNVEVRLIRAKEIIAPDPEKVRKFEVRVRNLKLDKLLEDFKTGKKIREKEKLNISRLLQETLAAITDLEKK
eukprot:m.218199 g.218199  ORF g.218199 m.218199 type:complete len:437 (+) comp39890_c3_seq10:1189-2499(+)